MPGGVQHLPITAITMCARSSGAAASRHWGPTRSNQPAAQTALDPFRQSAFGHSPPHLWSPS
jgi:hypothetical protein